MAAYDLEEQEQLDNLKHWWQQHGNKVAGIALAAALGVVSWQGWNWYQNQQADRASTLFGKLQQSLMENKPQETRALAGELMEKYGKTSYASLGALLAARVSFDAGDLKAAQTQLEWAETHGDDEVRDLARLRRAGVLLDEKAYDAALELLAPKPLETFAPAYAELKADVLFAQGKPAEARSAYQEALALLKAQTEKVSAAAEEEAGEKPADAPAAKAEDTDPLSTNPAAQLLQQKLDALGDA
ncbi:MAG: tetratricopeptide repeat protein [Zoogloeaceae bacterium]|jgi:predicted negative regulator of RcsB-dependent stress response|nr:tetratricopeptide repeat protein [Zoogloeaceae bacterium]